jgi:hypothetical protein
MPRFTFTPPSPPYVGNLYGPLFDREVVVIKGAPIPVTAKDRFASAAIVHEDGTLLGAVAMDLGCAAALGAAMALIPAGVVAETVKSGRLDMSLWENTLEVVNVSTRFFQPHCEGMLLASKGWVKPADMTPDVLQLLTSAPKKAFFKVDIKGYGGGHLGLYAIA